MDWQLLIHYLPEIIKGSLLTLSLVSTSLTIGFCLAIGFSLSIVSERPLLKKFVQSYIFMIRGTPLLVQFFLIYYGFGQLAWMQQSFLWVFFKQPFWCAMLTLALNTAAYTTELFVGAIRAVPSAEIEACRAFGMSWGLSLRRIIMPYAWRLVLPAYSNEVIMLVKASSLASTITLLELLGVTQQIINQTFLTLEFYTIAGIIYLTINSVLLGLFKQLERRYRVGNNA